MQLLLLCAASVGGFEQPAERARGTFAAIARVASVATAWADSVGRA